jgi:hypothetical protein
MPSCFKLKESPRVNLSVFLQSLRPGSARLHSISELKVTLRASVYQRKSKFVSSGRLSLLHKSAKEAVPASLHDECLLGLPFGRPGTPFRWDADGKSGPVLPTLSISDRNKNPICPSVLLANASSCLRSVAPVDTMTFRLLPAMTGLLSAFRGRRSRILSGASSSGCARATMKTQ